MHNKLNKLVNRSNVASRRLVMGVIAMTAVVGSALATDPAPNDYTTAITSFKTDMTGFFTTNGGALLGALVVMLAFGIVWKLIKRAAKSV